MQDFVTATVWNPFGGDEIGCLGARIYAAELAEDEPDPQSDGVASVGACEGILVCTENDIIAGNGGIDERGLVGTKRG